jgi:opacity protein-like surface antigen
VAAGRFSFFESNSLNFVGGVFGSALQGSTTLTGLLLGTGIEYAFAPNWSAKLEYDHTGYLSRHVGLGIITSKPVGHHQHSEGGHQLQILRPLRRRRRAGLAE